MKKYLVASTALISAMLAMPAQAELNLDLGGHFRGYGAFTDVDAAGTQDFELRRDTEIHFTGEATSDNGLTVGVHYEAMVGGELITDEAYAYFAGNWGRFNLGSEDGAAYLLQVAAPSGDSNVDGLRTNIQTVDATGLASIAVGSAGVGAGTYTGGLSDEFATNQAGLGARTLDYDHADFQDTDRLTYLTPKFSGFQGGVSYAPQSGQRLTGNGNAATATDAGTEFENLWEAAARWDGEFEGFGLSAGAGYSTAEAAGAATVDGDVNTWNAGLNVAFQGFSVGGAYLDTTAEDTGGDIEGDTWVVGAAWDNGPYHVGVSYLDQDVDNAGADIETDRWAVGAGYTYGPGMSFRGGVTTGNSETAATDEDFTQVTVGTDIQF
jgi:outer membrane protein OmpU